MAVLVKKFQSKFVKNTEILAVTAFGVSPKPSFINF